MNKKVLCTIGGVSLIFSLFTHTHTKYIKNIIDDTILVYANNNIEIKKDLAFLEEENSKLNKELNVYKYLYKDNLNIISKYKNILNDIENEVKISKIIDSKYNEYNYHKKDLGEFPIFTVDEINKFIEERSPENSSFRNKGELFLEVANEVGLDPRYLIAHSGLETGWGTSDIAKDKNNYYGIQAYNKSPYTSALSYDSMESGIREGAIWIKENYYNKGQKTLYSMINGDKAYAQTDEGKPDQEWIFKIVKIIY